LIKPRVFKNLLQKAHNVTPGKISFCIIFAASERSAHDGARGRRLGHFGALPGAARPVPGARAGAGGDAVGVAQQQPLERPQSTRSVQHQQRRRPPITDAPRLHLFAAGGAERGLPAHPRQVPKSSARSKLILQKMFGSTPNRFNLCAFN